MGGVPHNYINIREGNASVNLNGFTTTSSSSSTTNTVLNTVFSVLGLGVGLYAQARAERYQESGQTGQTRQVSEAEQQQIQMQQQVYAICQENDLAGISSHIANLEAQRNANDIEIAKYTSYENIESTEEYKTNEASIKELEDKYGFGSGEPKTETDDTKAGRAHQAAVQKLKALEATQKTQNVRMEALKQNLGENGDGKTGSLKAELDRLGDRKKALGETIGKYANSTDEQEKNEKFIAEQELQTVEAKELEIKQQIEREKNEFVKLKREQDEIKKAIEELKTESGEVKSNASPEVKNAYASYTSFLKKRDEFMGLKTGAHDKIESLRSKNASLEAEKILYNAAFAAEKAQTKTNAAFKSKVSGLGDNYIEADANDGNWWKRNMPSWLGGSKGLKKDKYKENHAAKKEAKAGLKNMGVDVDDYLKQQNMSNAAQFGKKLNGNFSDQLIYAYLKKNPGANETDVANGLKDNANKIAKQVKNSAQYFSANAKQNAIKQELIRNGYSADYAKGIADKY